MENRESELKASLEGLSERIGIKGFLYLYLEGDKIKMTGNMSMDALSPIILKLMERRFSGK